MHVFRNRSASASDAEVERPEDSVGARGEIEIGAQGRQSRFDGKGDERQVVLRVLNGVREGDNLRRCRDSSPTAPRSRPIVA